MTETIVWTSQSLVTSAAQFEKFTAGRVYFNDYDQVATESVVRSRFHDVACTALAAPSPERAAVAGGRLVGAGTPGRVGGWPSPRAPRSSPPRTPASGRRPRSRSPAPGWDVGITWHTDEKGAQQTAKEVREAGRRAEVARLDTTDVPGCGDVVDSLADALGGLDVLRQQRRHRDNVPLLEMTYDQWRHTVQADLDGAFVCIQRAARRMVGAGSGGRIIGITSVHEHQPASGPAPTTRRSTGWAAY